MTEFEQQYLERMDMLSVVFCDIRDSLSRIEKNMQPTDHRIREWNMQSLKAYNDRYNREERKEKMK